jgi:superfamily II DNA or RNA helicase
MLTLTPTPTLNLPPLKFPPRRWQQEAMHALNVQQASRVDLIRWIALALPGCGKSYFAMLMAREAIATGGQVLIPVTMSYLPAEFMKAAGNAGIAQHCEIVAPGEYFSGKKPVVIAMLQTLGSRKMVFRDLMARFWNHIIFDECHTSLNFEVAAEIAASANARTIGALTGTYFNGTAGVDERRKHGQYITRADPGCIFVAGSHEQMVDAKVLKPIIYHSLTVPQRKDGLCLRNGTAIANMAERFHQINPGLGRSIIFCSTKVRGHSPIDDWHQELTKRGAHVHVLTGDSTNVEIEAFKQAIARDPKACGLSAGMGSVGLDAPMINHVVIAHTSTNEGSERLYQQIGRGGRYDGTDDPCHVIDFGLNFRTAANPDGLHLPIEEAYADLARNPDRLIYDRFKSEGEAPPPPTGSAKTYACPTEGSMVHTLNPAQVSESPEKAREYFVYERLNAYRLEHNPQSAYLKFEWACQRMGLWPQYQQMMLEWVRGSLGISRGDYQEYLYQNAVRWGLRAPEVAEELRRECG